MTWSARSSATRRAHAFPSFFTKEGTAVNTCFSAGRLTKSEDFHIFILRTFKLNSFPGKTAMGGIHKDM
jgi:hypothetical protein